MDRKSFFKKALLGLGAIMVPKSILKSLSKEDCIKVDKLEGHIVGPPMFPYQDGVMPLYNQMQHAFGNYNRVVKSDKFYWAEYDSEHNDFKVISET